MERQARHSRIPGMRSNASDRYAHYEHAEHTEGHVGTAHGRIYDCGAGYSNWMQGWSDSKKDWCCDKEKKGCVKYHCSGTESAWGAQQSAWCLGCHGLAG